MDKVTMNKVKLLNIVEKNREEHEKLYAEAVEGFKKKRLDCLNRLADRAEKGELTLDIAALWALTQPQKHTKDYDRVINMLKQHTKDEVELTNADFGRYVEDEWGWKENFTNVTSAYTNR